MGWIVRGTKTDGEPISAVVEWDGEPLTEEQAYWYGWGLLRGIGFTVTDVRVERS